MPLWLTTVVLLVLWSVARVIRQTIVPFPPWAFEVSSVAFVLQFLFYAAGAVFEVVSHCVRTRVSLSRFLHTLSLSTFLLGGIGLYGLAGDVLGLASLWTLYLFCRALNRYRM